MKFNWQMFASMAIPFIRAAGYQKKNEDADNVGRDDVIGTSLVYVADLLQALVDGSTTLPKAPAALK